MILFFLFISFINTCSQKNTSYIKFINSSNAQEQILSIDTLIRVLDLIVKSNRSGYLVKENNRIFLCLWDKSTKDPASIFPLYKGTLILESISKKDSFSTFLINKEKLSEIKSNIEKGPIFRSIKIDTSAEERIEKLLQIISKIQLIIQL